MRSAEVVFQTVVETQKKGGPKTTFWEKNKSFHRRIVGDAGHLNFFPLVCRLVITTLTLLSIYLLYLNHFFPQKISKFKSFFFHWTSWHLSSLPILTM